MNNPLIGSTTIETVQNTAEAVSSLMEMLALKDSNLCRLLSPIAAALDHEADKTIN